MAEQEDSALDLEGFEKQLQSLFKNDCSGQALQVDGKTFSSDFRKLVEEYTCHWQTPLPQLRILEIALCYFDRESYLFPVGCDDVLSMLSSLALSVFELLLFFDKNDFNHDPLKHLAVSFQECHVSLARHQNVHLLQVTNCLQDGGPWANATLQSILTESTLPQTEVDRYISSQLPVLLELRVRYLLSCERVGEAMALAKCCSKHPTAGQHHFFLQVYLTWLHKTSQHDLLNKEVADLNGKDALHIICNMESEEKDESLLGLTRAFLSQELRRGDMDHLCDLVFLWSKLHMRLQTPKQVLLEESHELMLSATNVNSIFPFIRVILEELGEDGIQFCVELCTKTLQSCDVDTKSLIYKTLAGLFPNDLETCRACALQVYFLEHTVEAYKMVFQLYTQPDQEYHAEDSPVSNQVRFELLQVLKNGLHFDPEFCNLTALRENCKNLMSETVESAALEEILEWVPDYCIEEPDLHLSTLSSNFQQRTKVAPQAKKRKMKNDRNHMATKRRTASTAGAAGSAVDHAVKKKAKQGSRAVNETPLASLWQSFWQLEEMYHRLIPRFSEKKPPRRTMRKPQWLAEYSETPEDSGEASTSLPAGKQRRLMENAETHEDLDEASTSLQAKMKPAVVVLDKLPQIDEASASLLAKMKPATVVLPKLLPQTHEASSSLLVNGGPSQTLPAAVVLPKHSFQVAPCVSNLKDTAFKLLTAALLPLQQCSSEEEEEEEEEVEEEEKDCVDDSDAWWDPKDDSSSDSEQDSEPEYKETETLAPQVYSNAVTSLLVPGGPPCISTTKNHQRCHAGVKPCQDTHIGVQPFQRNEGFGQLGHPEERQPFHTGERPFGCNVCGKCFGQLRHLEDHHRVHTGERPFGCNVCGKHFPWKDSLRKHLHSHTGEKPYRCKVCGKDFTRKDSVRRHQRVHSGKKPYDCQECGRCFSERRYLRKHEQWCLSQEMADILQAHGVRLGVESPPSTSVPGDPPCISSAANQKQGDTDQPIPYSLTAHSDQDSEPEYKQTETLTPQANSNDLKSAAPELMRRDGTGQGRDSSLHPGVTSLTSQTPFFACTECLFSFTSQKFLLRHMRFRHKDVYFQLNGQIPSVACQKILSTAHLDLVPSVPVGTLSDESPPSTSVPGDPPCISSAANQKQGDTDQPIPHSLTAHSDQDSEPEYKQQETLTPQANSNGVRLSDKSPPSTSVPGDPPCISSAANQKQGDTDQPIPHSLTADSDQDSEPEYKQTETLTPQANSNGVRLGDESPPSTSVPGDPPCISSAADQKQGDTDQPIPHSLTAHSDQDSEPEYKQTETLTPQANSNDLKSAAPELMRRDGTGQGRDSSPHPGVTSQTSQTPFFACTECLFSFTSQKFLLRHMRSRHKDIYFQLNGQIPSVACQKILSTAHLDLVPSVPVGTLGDKSPPSTSVPGDSPCISSAANQKQGETDQPIPHSHQRFTGTLTQPKENLCTGQKRHNCELCDMSFSTLGVLRNHQALHTGMKPFHCEECDKSFGTAQYLRNHQDCHRLTRVSKSWQDMHAGELPFGCNICGKCFGRLVHLEDHHRVHTGDRPFGCDVCGKNFPRKDSLTKHLLTHTGEKRFRCKVCGKDFTRKDSLRKHQRVHTGEKPYGCQECGKRFGERRYLRDHEQWCLSQEMADIRQARGTVDAMCEISDHGTDYAHDALVNGEIGVESVDGTYYPHGALVDGEINDHGTDDAHNALVEDEIIEISDHDTDDAL